ncbi:MAG: hypothetical protein GY855_17840, partial [candidate division Zixibacteria bacterium]|nr:hypothetical protein [candidate division Zixibacteria bacterium]
MRNKLSLNVRLTAILGTLMLTFVGVISISLWTFKAQEKTASAINVAGRQRMLTQKYTKEILLTELKGKMINNDPSTNDPVGKQYISDKTAELFETTQKALTHGGSTFADLDMTIPINIEAPSNNDIKSQLKIASNNWNQLISAVSKLKSVKIDTPEYHKHLDQVRKASIGTLREMHTAVTKYEASANRQADIAANIQYLA